MKTQKRSRQRRCKLSRRMKKRGGGGKKRNRAYSEHTSSIVSKEIIGRPSFFEPTNNKVYKPSNTTTENTFKGANTIFNADTPAGHAKVVVNTRLDEAKQRNAYDRFNLKFQRIQDYYIDQLNKGMLDPKTQWVRVRARVDKAVWYTDGTWKMLPMVLSGYYYNNDFESLVRSGKIKISDADDNLKNEYWVPSKYIDPPPVQTTSSDIDRYD